MTMPSNDEAARIASADIGSYLRRSGWRHETSDRTTTWTTLKGAQTLRAVLPNSPDAIDFAEFAYSALRVVAFAEDRSIAEVLSDIEYGGADIVSVRLAASAPSGQAPLPLADAAISALRLYVIGAAAALDFHSGVLPARRPRAERYADKVRLSTSSGSFVLNLAMPIFEEPGARPDNGQATLDEVVEIETAAFGRDVARRMRSVAERATHLAAAIEGADDDVTAFENDPNTTGNATELDALAQLSGRNDLEYRLRFAHSRVLGPDQALPPLTIRVAPNEQRIFRSAADLLRSRRPKDDVTVNGTIVALSRDDAFGPGEVVIRGVEVGSTTAHRYRVALSADQYAQALESHAQGLWVSARGALVLHGNFLLLQNLLWFLVQQRLPE